MGGAVARFAILFTDYTTGEVLGASARISRQQREDLWTSLGRECMHAATQAGEAWDYPQPFDNVTPTTCAGCVRKYAIRSTAAIRGRRIG